VESAPQHGTVSRDLAARLTLPEYPRSAGHEPEWMLRNLMGPNAVWLMEALSQVMDLRPGMRVLDMGCGRAISSIFLARELGLEVWAADLWIKPSDNWQRIQEAQVADRVFPIYADAHALPFADAFFDAIVSVDAYHYFGTDDLYLDSFARLVKSGGQIGIVVPGLTHELDDGLPDHLAPFWRRDFWSFHSPAWWRRHWTRGGSVEVEIADLLVDGWRHWLLWLEVAGEHGFPTSAEEAEMLRQDEGQTLGFTRLVARRI
jgi:cyclopropane fatty-acyl-phospholipid synthase-like methyltransferase